MGLRLPKDTQIASMDLIAAFDYQTTQFVKMQMEVLSHVQV